MMLTISPLLTLLTVVTVPLSLWVTRVIARRSQRLFVAQWANTGRLNAHIEETYSGFTVVKTFGHRARAQEQFREFNDDVYQASFGAQFLSGLVSPATMFIGNLSYVAVAVVGGLQVATGQITLGSIQAFIQYVRQFNQPLTQVAGDVQHPAVRDGQCGAGFRPARRRRGVTGPACRAAVARRQAGPGRVRARQLQLPARHPGDRGPVAGRRTGQHRGDRRADRRGQDDAGEPADAVLRRRLGPHPHRRRRHLVGEPAVAALADRDGAAGHLAVRRHHLRQHRLRAARGRARTR